MILRRFGATVASVEPRFDARALTEIRFARTDAFEIPTEGFESDWERVIGHELTATAEGDVQDAAEREVLERLQSGIDELVAGLAEGEVLLIESESGRDYPKTRDRKRPVIVDGENRFRSEWRIEPPLKVAVFRRLR